jgi:predicted ester cyclase
MVHEETFMGVAGTGRKVSLAGITILRFAKGKIVQGWDNWDQLGLLAQIGAVPDRFAPVAA